MWKRTSKDDILFLLIARTIREHICVWLSDKFTLAMFQHSAPTLLAYGGTYANLKEMNVKNILPFAFLFGIGGPKMKRKVKVSYELCIQ
jgi:hypothetical protein